MPLLQPTGYDAAEAAASRVSSHLGGQIKEVVEKQARADGTLQDLNQKLEAHATESQYFRDRLLATSTVAAHTASRVAALEEENRALKERLATLEMIILGKKQE